MARPPPPPRLAATRRSDWDWFWTAGAPVLVHGEDPADWLTDDDTHEIDALLTRRQPRHSTWPGDGRDRRWAGIRADGGRLAAVVADTSRSATVGHLSSVAPRRRIAVRTTVRRRPRETKQMLAEGPEWVTLGMHADNDADRQLYERLGFICSHRFTSADVARASGRATSSPA